MTTLEKIKALDPQKDYWQIVRLSAFYEFPWDFTRSLEFALFRTFASPSISATLAKAHEFEKRPQKRYDDTDLILSEILENGLDSPRAIEAIKRMNFIHSHFNISNDDYLYVLSTFIFEPERWIDQRGYRKLTENELIAAYKVWEEIGGLMGIRNIPATRQELEKFNLEYEAEHFVPAATNNQIATYTENLFLGWWLPKFAFGLGRPFVRSLMDDRLLQAVGFKKPNWLILQISAGAFAIRKMIIQLLPKRTKPMLRTKLPRKQTYPTGYEVKNLGSIPYRDEA